MSDVIASGAKQSRRDGSNLFEISQRRMKRFVFVLSLIALASCGKKEQPTPAPPPPPPNPNPGAGSFGGCGNVGGVPLTPNIPGYSATLTSSYGGYGWGGGNSTPNSLTLQIFHSSTNYRFEDPVQTVVASGSFSFPGLLDFYPTPFPQTNIPTTFCVSSANLGGGPPITGLYYTDHRALSLTLQGLAQAPLTNPFGNNYSGAVQYTPLPVRLELQGSLSYLRIVGQVLVTLGSGNSSFRLYYHAQ